nr:MAG TPA: hypothetical protein [Bacteriophage sp.]
MYYNTAFFTIKFCIMMLESTKYLYYNRNTNILLVQN